MSDPATADAAGQNDIVVTAGKLNRTVADTATGVATIDAARLEASGYLEARDAFQLLPNVNIAGSDGRFAIRGVAFDSVNGVGVGQLATTYIDGVRMSDKSVRFGPDLTWDVAQIQVLYGAQSTLQGRNALAGSIYITTRDPSFKWHGAARGIVLDNGWDGAAALGGPVIDDLLAFRVSGEVHRGDPDVDNPVRGKDRAPRADDKLGRIKLLLTPAANFTAHAVFAYGDIRRRDASGDRRMRNAQGYLDRDPTLARSGGFEAGLPGTGPAERISYVDIDEYDRNKTATAGVTLDWKVAPQLTLTSESTYLNARNYKQRDNDGGVFNYTGYPAARYAIANPLGIGAFDYVRSGTIPISPIAIQQQNAYNFTQEVRGLYQTKALRLVAGFYYTKEVRHSDNFSSFVFVGIPNSVKALLPAALPAATKSVIASFYTADTPLYTFNSQPYTIYNWALYTEGELALSERVTLSGGIRYDNELNRSATFNSGAVLLPDPALVPAALRPTVLQINSARALNPFMTASDSARLTFHAFLPKAALRVALSDELTVGLVAQRAYRPGGTSTNAVRQIVSPLLPEYTWNFEAFLRSTLLDGRARFNANAYFTDWRDQQVVIALSTQPNDQIGANAGHSQLYGFEAQFDMDLTKRVRARLGAGYSHTEFLSFNVTVPASAASFATLIDPKTFDAIVGSSFVYAPHWSLIGGLDWKNERGMFAGVNANYRSAAWSDLPNKNKVDGRALVDLRVGYRMSNVTLSGFVRNLFGTDWLQSDDVRRPILGDPRSAGVAAQFQF